MDSTKFIYHFSLLWSSIFSGLTRCVNHFQFPPVFLLQRWSQWPRSLRHGTTATPWLRLWVRIIFVSCECCVSSGRGFCVGVNTCSEDSEDSYRAWSVYDRRDSTVRRLWPTSGYCAIKKRFCSKWEERVNGYRLLIWYHTCHVTFSKKVGKLGMLNFPKI